MTRLSILFALLVSSLSAQPAQGDLAPDFELKSLAGDSVRLSERTSAGPVVLLVLRGFPGYQCPLCSRQVQDFVKNADAFAAAGARVVMVYPGPAESLHQRASEFVAGKPLPATFDLLLDPDYAFTNLYKLRWNEPKETAYPSTFVIARDGRVVMLKISRTHGGRTSAREVLDSISTLPSRAARDE